MMSRPPCIRDLYIFRKTGCPQQKWDGERGCSAWLEQVYDSVDKTQPPTIVKACMDLISFDMSLKMLQLLEGNQVATETLRNGLCETVEGRVEPKPDRGVVHLLNLLTMNHNSKLLE